MNYLLLIGLNYKNMNYLLLIGLNYKNTNYLLFTDWIIKILIMYCLWTGL